MFKATLRNELAGLLMEEIIDRDTFRTDAEFEAVKDFTVLKVKDVMKGLLTMENGEGEEFVDYNYLRRDLSCPFGEDAHINSFPRPEEKPPAKAA